MRQGAGARLRRDGIALAVVTVVYLAISAFVTNSYYQLILTLVPIWAVFGVSWNILSGYGGQLVVRPRVVLRHRRLHGDAGAGLLEPDAVARHSARHGASARSPR